MTEQHRGQIDDPLGAGPIEGSELDEQSPAGEYGGFEFGSVATPAPAPVAEAAPRALTDVERLLAMTSNAPAQSDYRSAGGGPLTLSDERYEDLEALGGDSDVKFRPNETLRHQGSQVYMLDANGAPHFLKPWTPETAVKLTSRLITKFQLGTAILVLATVGLSVSGAFTDREYVDLSANGEQVTAIVATENFEGLTGDDAGLFDHVLVLDYGDGNTIETHEVSETPGSGEASVVGDEMKFFVDPADPDRFALVREKPEQSWSLFSLIPLLGVGVIANRWAAVATINRKMRKLAKGGSPLLKGSGKS